jgi:Histidine kinase-, DNA gyrase B-, and HSP90-like ATPase
VTATPLNFTTDAGIIARLGRELVGKQETALTELIKNTYDTDATHVTVILEESRVGSPKALEIRDNGSGMSLEELTEGFLRIASDTKVREPRSPRYSRIRAGRKGIGRFAAQRLGRTLALTTRSIPEQPGLKLKVDWDAFAPGRELGQVPVIIEPAEVGPQGTTVRVERLRDYWTDAQFRRCLRNVMSLLQPFPVAPVAGRKHTDPGFEVQFLRGADRVEDTVIADLQTEILAHAHAIIEGA